MEESEMKRILVSIALVAAAAVPASAASVVAGGTAYAGSGITCSKIAGNFVNGRGNIKISHCTPSGGREYKRAMNEDYSGGEGDLGNLQWNGGGTTTVSNISWSEQPGSNPACPSSSQAYAFASGTVTAVSSSGTGIPAIGDTVSWSVCVGARGQASLQRRTVVHL
jgi:opacity protein-like surface antigen